MREYQFELAIGESLQVGDRILTIVDVERDEISFRIEDADSFVLEGTFEGEADRTWLPPR